MYSSCNFWTTDKNGKSEGKSVSIHSYTLEQFKKCLHCKHFRTFYEDYSCDKPDGKECLLGHADYFEAKK